MYTNHQSFFLPEGLSTSSSTSSIESTLDVVGHPIGSRGGDFSSSSSLSMMSNGTVGTEQQQPSAYRRHLDHVINGKEGKMFVGGLSWLSSTESMRAYFEKFDPVEDCVIMRDAKTKITRGFGFVTFVNSKHINNVLAVKEHFLDGKKIDPQVAIRHISPARSVNNICRKVFIGGVSQQCSVEDVKEYFSRFGQVEDAILKMDYPKQQHRGFGFLTFVDGETAEAVCTIRYHVIKDKQVECKMAQKKEFVKPNAEAAAAASTFLNNLPPEQVLAIYDVLLKGIVGNQQQATTSPAVLPQQQQHSQQQIASALQQVVASQQHQTQQQSNLLHALAQHNQQQHQQQFSQEQQRQQQLAQSILAGAAKLGSSSPTWSSLPANTPSLSLIGNPASKPLLLQDLTNVQQQQQQNLAQLYQKFMVQQQQQQSQKPMNPLQSFAAEQEENESATWSNFQRHIMNKYTQKFPPPNGL